MISQLFAKRSQIGITLLALFISFTAIAKESASPQCFDRLLQAMITDYSDTGALNYRNLPNEISFRPSHKELNKMTALAGKAFKSESRMKKVMKAVDRLAENTELSTDFDTVLKLKTGRKYGVMIRESFLLFDQKHSVPKDLERFVTKFGKLNDAIRVGDTPEHITEAAQALRKSFEELPDLDVIEKLKISSTDGFDDYFRQTLKELYRELNKEILPAEEYHSMRKTIRRLGTYYQLKYAIEPLDENEAVMMYLKALSDKMGDTHNEMVQSNFKGDVKYSEIKRPLEINLRKNIKRFLQAVENDQDKLIGL